MTRRALEHLATARTPIGLVTKGPMVVRDIDVLQAVGRQARCSVYLSVPSVDEEAWRRLEPGTAHPLQRLKAVRKLADAGIAANVLMAPLLPGITTSRSAITATIRAIADHGATAVGANVVRLDAGTREHFLRVLAAEYPHLSEGYERLFAGGARQVPKDYAHAVQQTVRDAMVMAGLAEGGEPEARDLKQERGSRGGAGDIPAAGAHDPRAGSIATICAMSRMPVPCLRPRRAADRRCPPARRHPPGARGTAWLPTSAR